MRDRLSRLAVLASAAVGFAALMSVPWIAARQLRFYIEARKGALLISEPIVFLFVSISVLAFVPFFLAGRPKGIWTQVKAALIIGVVGAVGVSCYVYLH